MYTHVQGMSIIRKISIQVNSVCVVAANHVVNVFDSCDEQHRIYYRHLNINTHVGNDLHNLLLLNFVYYMLPISIKIFYIIAYLWVPYYFQQITITLI